MRNQSYGNIALLEEIRGCLLCNNAPCTKACPYGLEPDKVIRSLRFENRIGAANRLPEDLPCLSCAPTTVSGDAPATVSATGSCDCMKACLKGRINKPVQIDAIMKETATYRKVKTGYADLSIDFCGVRCENPFFLSSSVVGSNYEMVSKAFEMGWAGVAFKTISAFIPKEVSPRFDVIRMDSASFAGLKNIEQTSEHSLQENLSYLTRLKKSYPKKIIMASILGGNEEEWTELSKAMTEAGVDIIECNFSCPHMAADGLGSDVGQNPRLVDAFIRAAKKGTHLPLLAKMTPNIGNMEIPAIAAIEAGATGLAAINTIKSIMNVNLETFASGPDVRGETSIGGYSGKAVKPIALRFIQSLKSCEKLKNIPVSGMGGIETWRDAAEFFSLGCENVQVTTAIMQYGYRIIEDLLEGMKLYLCSHGYRSISEIVGKALPHIIPAERLDRDSLCYPIFDRRICLGCGRCYLSCYDGGHQAIRQNTTTGMPILDPKKCVGCHLCLTICPVQAITPGARLPKAF